MTSLIDLIISTINNLLVSFANMHIITNLNLFTLLLITVIVVAVIDVVGRLAK